VCGLDGGDETEGVEAGLVGGMDDLGVFDAVAGGGCLAGTEGCGVGVAVGRRGGTGVFEGGGESGNGVPVGEVADCVDVNLIVERGPGGCQRGQGAGVDEETAGAGGAVGVRFYQSRTPGAEGAI